MRVLVCGGRNFDNLSFVDKCLDKHNIDEIIEGGASGADHCAFEWARMNYKIIHEYPANWPKYGKAAGPWRNNQMLAMKPDLVVSFPGGAGTAHMVDIATKAGIEVIAYSL